MALLNFAFDRRKFASAVSGGLLGFRSLRQRLSLMPVAAVVTVSLVANLLVHRKAGDELYQSREQLARGLADNVSRRLFDQLSEIRHELSSWAPFVARLAARNTATGALHHAFQEWLPGLGEPAQSRYDLITVVDRAGRVLAINEIGLSVPTSLSDHVRDLLGQDISGLVGEDSDAWMRPTWQEGLVSVLPWREIAAVNELYGRGAPGTPDDNVRRRQLVFAVPVRQEDGDSLATTALVAVASWAPFQRILDEAEAYLTGVGLPTGYGFVFDNAGDRIIGHKLRDPQSQGQDLLGRSVSRDYELPHLVDAAVQASGRAFEYDFPPGNKKFAVFRAVEPAARSHHAFDWRLGIGVDYSDIFAPLARLRDAVILSTLAITLAVALVGVWLGRSLSLSVKEFSHLATEAAAGRFDLISRAASHDEISELAAAMNRLFVSMRQRVEVQPIPNPYVVGTPVRSATMLYGRQEDTKWITDRLLQPGNELILLYGARRIGKTSLLHQIRNQRGSISTLPVFVDTHALLPVLRSDDDFYSALGRSITRELTASDAPPTTTEPVQSAHDLVATVHALNREFPTHTLVLLFDEFEALDLKMHDGTLSPGISSFLASLLESSSRVSIIATGSSDGSGLIGPFWSTLASKAIGRRLGLLSRTEGMRLICEPVGGHVEFEDGVPEYILRLTGAHPYYTQTVCQRLVDTLNERHTRCASQQVVARVIEQLLAEPPLPLDDMWRSSTPLQRWTMAELARLLPDPDARVNADAVLVSAQHGPTAVVAELRRLTSAEMLEEAAGGYRFSIDFVRLWMRKEQLWWQVADKQRRYA